MAARERSVGRTVWSVPIREGLDDDLLAVEGLSRARGITKADWIREAMREKLRGRAPRPVYQPEPIVPEIQAKIKKDGPTDIAEKKRKLDSML
jgi:hypothetical protein